MAQASDPESSASDSSTPPPSDSQPGRGRRRVVDDRVAELMEAIGVTANRDQVAELLDGALRLATGSADRLDLKIANAALQEMREGFEVFAPYRDVRKVTMFGSARTLPSDPLYDQARDVASRLAAEGWSTVTGAGPGIMAAGLEGAGPDHAFGVTIRLPFEQEANEFLAAGSRLVTMKYFFTRKLLLVKESDGYVVLPGGFGTLDEGFELLTLLQTGKAEPAPVVLLDTPGGGYWQAWERFLTDEVASRGLIGSDDRVLYRITDNVEDAASEILGFYRNFHSLRWVGQTLVIRLQRAPSAGQAAKLSEQFVDICTTGGIEVLPGPLPAERGPGGHPELPRVAFRFDGVSFARLRQLIDALNREP